MCAAEEGDLKNLTDLLKTTNLDVNKGNKNKETALHLAAANGRKEIVKLLALNNMRLDVLDLVVYFFFVDFSFFECIDLIQSFLIYLLRMASQPCTTVADAIIRNQPKRLLIF